MRIAVMSPHTRNNGNTTLAMLIALKMSATGKKTCLAHVMPISNPFYHYFNFTGFEDKTSTSSQIVKVLREGGLSGDEVCDYCKRIDDNLEAFTNNATNFDQDDMDFMVKYISKAFPHEHIVFDADSDDRDKDLRLSKLCDVIILNINQSVSELSRFKEKKDEYMRIIEGKPVVVVVNKFNSIKGTLKETAHWMGVKQPNNWIVLHENPWITWATNHGKLDQLFKKIMAKDPRVIELHSDLTKITTTLVKAKLSRDKKSGGRRE